MGPSWKVLFDDGYGNLPTGIKYSNGFKFEGSLDQYQNPILGRITDPNENLVYEGKIERDIYGYFQVYIEKGRTLNEHGL